VFRHTETRVSGRTIHAVEAGAETDVSVVLLHGWPQSWAAWRRVMALACDRIHVIAVDLPGVGGSLFETPFRGSGDIAATLHSFVRSRELQSVVVVGHDVGGQIAYRCARDWSSDIAAAVIMNVAVPGIPPWEEIWRNPAIWHFAFHAVPDLPEALVRQRERRYFDYFYDTIARHPERITARARAEYARAYRVPGALRTGFDWYRSFGRDAEENAAAAQSGSLVDVPLLYMRGKDEHGAIEDYLSGFRRAGFRDVRGAVIDDCGHFSPEEQPEAVWWELTRFLAIPEGPARRFQDDVASGSS